METLYDLLGALPRDDAEELRVAFRRAVKGVHPDLNPGDPDAAVKFRQIVRASKILGDADQRATYDHLLELARVEQELASKRPVTAALQQTASGAIALTVASAALAGIYFLTVRIPLDWSSPISPVAAAVRQSAETVTKSVTAALTPTVPAASPAPEAVMQPTAATSQPVVADAPAAGIGPPLDITPPALRTKSSREHGTIARGNASADSARLKRAANHAKSPPAQAATKGPFWPVFRFNPLPTQRRTANLDPSRAPQ